MGQHRWQEMALYFRQLGAGRRAPEVSPDPVQLLVQVLGRKWEAGSEHGFRCALQGLAFSEGWEPGWPGVGRVGAKEVEGGSSPVLTSAPPIMLFWG